MNSLSFSRVSEGTFRSFRCCLAAASSFRAMQTGLPVGLGCVACAWQALAARCGKQQDVANMRKNLNSLSFNVF